MTAFIWAYLGSTKHSIQRAGYNKIYSYLPFLNVFFFLKASTKPMYWFLLMFVPFLNLILFSMIILDHLKQQNIEDKKTKILMVLFYPIMSRGVL